MSCLYLYLHGEGACVGSVLTTLDAKAGGWPWLMVDTSKRALVWRDGVYFRLRVDVGVCLWSWGTISFSGGDS